jgi:leucyl aminopeptidase
MTDALKLGFGSFASPIKTGPSGVLVVFCDDALKFGPATRKALGSTADLVARAAKAERFAGKKNATLELVIPEGLKIGRLVVIGVGKASELKAKDFLRLGGLAMGKLPNAASDAIIFAELPGGAMKSDQAADLAQGMRLRAYSFDRYKTKRKDEEKPPKTRKITIATADTEAARKAYDPRSAISDGVLLARDLVNEPANVLYPEEFARRASALKKLRVSVEVLDIQAMKKLGMNALLGVGQGSARASRVVVMRWNGGKAGDAPVAFIGKGVCFDTGGISIKPAAGMEDMKGDMAGAACVVGLMHALAARKAKVNAVGVIGVVENMPDGNAQRPGDIVKSMSGQTIEIINTDAEGRLVLADVTWYTAQRFKPKFMVDLATLTGAIIVALGQEYAGMFCNNDQLAERLTKAGLETGELVWRMPLAPEYDKMIDSKFADMKNTGGSRWGGAITAAQFIKRFVDDKTPWAHLDIAGTGFDSRQTDINRSWGSGWGVRLLDRLIADHYER